MEINVGDKFYRAEMSYDHSKVNIYECSVVKATPKQVVIEGQSCVFHYKTHVPRWMAEKAATSVPEALTQLRKKLNDERAQLTAKATNITNDICTVIEAEAKFQASYV